MHAVVNGVGIEYSIDGEEGPWLVLSHSLGCTRAMWNSQMVALTSKYRVLRYDSRGHGESEGPPGAYTLERLADDAAALMEHLDIERAIWIGFSMGGMIGQVFALRHAAKLQALVLADTTSEHHATPKSVWDERIRVAHEGGMQPLVQPAIQRWFTQTFRESQPEIVAPVAAMIAGTSVNGWAGCCAAISDVHTTERLLEVTCPALVIVGEYDIGTPIDSALTIQRHLRQSTLVVITDAAHMTCIEQPEQFNRALGMFLDSLPNGSSAPDCSS